MRKSWEVNDLENVVILSTLEGKFNKGFLKYYFGGRKVVDKR